VVAAPPGRSDFSTARSNDLCCVPCTNRPSCINNRGGRPGRVIAKVGRLRLVELCSSPQGCLPAHQTPRGNPLEVCFVAEAVARPAVVRGRMRSSLAVRADAHHSGRAARASGRVASRFERRDVAAAHYSNEERLDEVRSEIVAGVTLRAGRARCRQGLIRLLDCPVGLVGTTGGPDVGRELTGRKPRA
jgi:hypothetical protein